MPESAPVLLQQGLRHLGVCLADAQQDTLLAYLDLVHRWNKAYNLTAVRGLDTMVTRHLLDSLAVIDLLPSGVVLDVGSGAGLPGVPLAIARPDQTFHLLDSNGKKTRFLFHVKTQLALDNVEVLEHRVESYRPSSRYPTIISRAFASLDTMVSSCAHLLAPQGVMLAMKAIGVHDEVTALEDRGVSVALQELQVPGLDETRYLAQLALSQ